MFHFDWIQRHAERTPDKVALVDGASGQRWTYAELNARANRLASFLGDTVGLRRGDRISILAQNSAAYFELLFACSKIGAILNTLNWRLAPPELAYIVDDCAPRVLVYDAGFAGVVEEVRAQAGGWEAEIVIGDDGANEEPALEYETALEQGDPDLPARSPRLAYDDTWAILYTSGTTGRPKGAQVTYGNFFYNAVGIGQAIDLTSEDVNLVVLPTFHAGGLGLYAAPTFHAGGTVVVMRSFGPAQMLRLIEQWAVTAIFLVPAIYLALADFAEFGDYDLSSVRSWGSGGSALPPALVTHFAEQGIIIQQGFGMTETGPTVFLIPEEDAVRKAGSVGKPVLHTDVRIVDREGRVLGLGEVGELCIRGGNVTSGYWNRPQATAETIVDGWLHSGDAARYDGEGFYFIVDRWKDMFISGGENVYPAEVENVLYEHPAVAEAAVIGVPHPRWQEAGRALVVLREGQTTDEAALIAFCEGKLARYKIPRSVRFVDALPRTAAGKVLKRELQRDHGEPIETAAA